MAGSGWASAGRRAAATSPPTPPATPAAGTARTPAPVGPRSPLTGPASASDPFEWSHAARLRHLSDSASVRRGAAPPRWDAALHARVGRLPTPRVDVWLRRLSGFADHGGLWMLIGGVLGAQRGSAALRRSAVRGLGSLALTSALVNLVLKRVFR